MKIENLYPIGTIVKLRNSENEFIIVGRMQKMENGKYAQYSAVVYPQGISSDEFTLFNNREINQLVYVGYKNELEKEMEEELIAKYKEQL